MAKQLQYMDALGPTIAKARFAAEGGDVAAEEARLMNPDYVAPGVMEQSTGTLQEYTPTMRENAESKIAGSLENIGMSKQSARDSAIGFTGSTDSSRNFPAGVGALDFFPPFGIPTAVQEAGREVKAIRNDPNSSGTDYIFPALTVGLSVAESLPLAKAATAPLKGFIKNLAAKSKPVAEPLIAAAGPVVPRRTVIKGIAATPVAGALSKLPLGKVDEVAKVAKVAKAVPKLSEDITQLPSFMEAFKKIQIRIGMDEAGMMTNKEIRDLGLDPDDLTFDDYADIGKAVDDGESFSINELELFDMESENINKWLNDEIRLDKIDTGEFPVVGPVLQELQEVHGMSKPQIKNYLIENDILDD